MYALNSLANSYNYGSSFNDPRLISSAHSGQRLLLDAPVRDGSVQMKKIPFLETTDYIHDNYGNIKTGDVSYYYDSHIGKPFFQPLFDPSDIVKVDYIDPMGTYKAHYYRKGTDDRHLGLSWLTDSQFHRNDILARSMWRRNQTEPMYIYEK